MKIINSFVNLFRVPSIKRITLAFTWIGIAYILSLLIFGDNEFDFQVVKYGTSLLFSSGLVVIYFFSPIIQEYQIVSKKYPENEFSKRKRIINWVSIFLGSLIIGYWAWKLSIAILATAS